MRRILDFSVCIFLFSIRSCTGNPTILRELELGNIDAAFELLVQTFAQSERNPDALSVTQKLSQRKIRRGGGFFYTSQYKLEADLEQAKYLASKLQAENPDKAAYFSNTVIPIYERVLARIPPLEDLLEASHGLYQFTQVDMDDGIGDVYNKALHIPSVDEFDTDGITPIDIFSKSFDPEQIQEEWSQNGIVVIDDLLSAEALARIRKVMEASTVFYQTKLPKKFGGYTGAYIDDGLHQRILLALTIELRKRLPFMLQDHPLQYLWAYKYSADNKGINLHADQAAVNVNIWLTPEHANLDKTSGGLVIFTVKPPNDWDLNQYNRDTDLVYEQLLKPANFENITVPYKENRAVIFDSALFHQTDTFTFQQGYTNRRINLTILYGEMQTNNDEKRNVAKAEAEL